MYDTFAVIGIQKMSPGGEDEEVLLENIHNTIPQRALVTAAQYVRETGANPQYGDRVDMTPTGQYEELFRILGLSLEGLDRADRS